MNIDAAPWVPPSRLAYTSYFNVPADDDAMTSTTPSTESGDANGEGTMPQSLSVDTTESAMAGWSSRNVEVGVSSLSSPLGGSGAQRWPHTSYTSAALYDPHRSTAYSSYGSAPATSMSSGPYRSPQLVENSLPTYDQTIKSGAVLTAEELERVAALDGTSHESENSQERDQPDGTTAAEALEHASTAKPGAWAVSAHDDLESKGKFVVQSASSLSSSLRVSSPTSVDPKRKPRGYHRHDPYASLSASAHHLETEFYASMESGDRRDQSGSDDSNCGDELPNLQVHPVYGIRPLAERDLKQRNVAAFKAAMQSSHNKHAGSATACVTTQSGNRRVASAYSVPEEFSTRQVSTVRGNENSDVEQTSWRSTKPSSPLRGPPVIGEEPSRALDTPQQATTAVAAAASEPQNASVDMATRLREHLRWAGPTSASLQQDGAKKKKTAAPMIVVASKRPTPPRPSGGDASSRSDSDSIGNTVTSPIARDFAAEKLNGNASQNRSQKGPAPKAVSAQPRQAKEAEKNTQSARKQQRNSAQPPSPNHDTAVKGAASKVSEAMPSPSASKKAGKTSATHQKKVDDWIFVQPSNGKGPAHTNARPGAKESNAPVQSFGKPATVADVSASAGTTSFSNMFCGFASEVALSETKTTGSGAKKPLAAKDVRGAKGQKKTHQEKPALDAKRAGERHDGKKACENSTTPANDADLLDSAVSVARAKKLAKKNVGKEAHQPREVIDDDELLNAYAGAAQMAVAASGLSAEKALALGCSDGTAVASSTGAAGGKGGLRLLGISLRSIPSAEHLLRAESSTAHLHQYETVLNTLKRAVQMSDNSSVKPFVLHKLLATLPRSTSRQEPGLVCALLLESSECSLDVEKCLSAAHTALKLAEDNDLPVLEMLARLAVTRTLARVVDTSESRAHLTRALRIAVEHEEVAAAGWLVMQMGVTLELSGQFPECFEWYALAVRLAELTSDNRLLCDALCCQSIAYCAVGELELAAATHNRASDVMHSLPRSARQRVLQNLVQYKFQKGDVEGALALQMEELSITREAADAKLVPHCIGSIALTRRYLQDYDGAAAAYAEELNSCTECDLRQSVECFLGMAVCHRANAHLTKAYDLGMRALRAAYQLNDATTTAKSLMELAETELVMAHYVDAERNLLEALRTTATVDDHEQKQYLVKAALCEIDWRCCNALERLYCAAHKETQALVFADHCCVPNTFDLSASIARVRGGSCTVPKALLAPAASSYAMAQSPSNLVDLAAVEALLKTPTYAGKRIVCYSLPWNDGLQFTAYVVSLSANTSATPNARGGQSLSVVAHSLTFSDAAVLMCTWEDSAFARAFDAPMVSGAEKRLYGETPLWPQQYSQATFDILRDTTEERTALRTNVHDSLQFCLSALYDCFVRPIESDVFPDGGAELNGLVFVGDGIVSRLPFSAMHDGAQHLVKRVPVYSVPSLALLVELSRIAASVPRDTSAKAEDADLTTVVQVITSSLPSSERNMRTIVSDTCAAVNERSNTTSPAAAFVEDIIAENAESAPDKDNNNNNKKPLAISSPSPLQEVEALEKTLSCRAKNKALSNQLYFAVHQPARTVATPRSLSSSSILCLDLPVLPEMREDYCGSFVSGDDSVVANAADIAKAWNLSRRSLVICGGCGMYSNASLHETGVPVYRALQYAGAARLLVPLGSRLPNSSSNSVVGAALAAAVDDGATPGAINAAIRKEQIRLIAAGASPQEWGSWVFVGIP